jgi:hypothetical protein
MPSNTFSLARELQGCSEMQRMLFEMRIRDIASRQRQNGMEPRDDSMLTWKHINQFPQSHPSDIDVAKELVAVHFIHNHTAYRNINEAMMRSFAGDLVQNHNFFWGDAYQLARKYVPDMVKLFCLMNEKKTIPAFLN